MTTAALATGGWMVALLAALLALAARSQLRRRLEWISRASHELRGGIGAVRLGLAVAAPGRPLGTLQLRAVELELDRAVLALQELDGGPVGWAFEYIDVFELLAESVEASRPAAAVHGAELGLRWSGEPAAVIGDRVRVAQAISNLIANAIEHGGGAVEVCGASVGEAVRIEVLDGGPGLPKPVAELTRDRRGQRGRGLGLRIAADIVAGHGGRLSAAPSVGGARLMLELPAPPGLQEQWRAS